MQRVTELWTTCNARSKMGGRPPRPKRANGTAGGSRETAARPAPSPRRSGRGRSQGAMRRILLAPGRRPGVWIAIKERRLPGPRRGTRVESRISEIQ
jgi:hypothetical protein